MRVWKLGSLEHGIFPTAQAVQKLQDLLDSGATDIIWGPDLEIIEVDEDNDSDLTIDLKFIKDDVQFDPDDLVQYIEDKVNEYLSWENA